MKRLVSILSCAVLLIYMLWVPAAAQCEDTEALIEKTLAYELELNGVDSVQEWISGGLSDTVGGVSEWFIFALSRYAPECDYSIYAASLEKHAEEKNIVSATARQRLALAFLASGYNSAYIEKTADDSIGEQGVMSWVFGLHLLNNGAVSHSYTQQSAAEQLLALQLEDGGWAVTGEAGDPDVTSMAIQALAPLITENETASAAVDKALLFLSEKQLEDGGYMSFGVANPESACQVLIALLSIGVEPLTDARFVKNGKTLLDGILKYALGDGSFSHLGDGKANTTATMQAFLAFVALWSYENNLGPFYAFDVQELGEIPQSAFDARENIPQPSEEMAVMPERSEVVRSAMPAWKTAALIGIGVFCLGGCAVLAVRRKRSWKSYVFLVLLGAAAAFAVVKIQIARPGDYYGTGTLAQGDTITASISIRCDAVAGQKDFIPADGVILDTCEITLTEGSSAYNQLVAAAREHSIQLDSVSATTYGPAYIKGLGYLYEYDFGELSGWMYSVNGEFASVGCGEYELQDGDSVVWEYTLELGNDLKEGNTP